MVDRVERIEGPADRLEGDAPGPERVGGVKALRTGRRMQNPRTGDSSSYATAGRPPESTAQSRSGSTACNPADFGEVQDTKRLRTGVAVQASVCVMSKVNIEIEREAEGLSD